MLKLLSSLGRPFVFLLGDWKRTGGLFRLAVPRSPISDTEPHPLDKFAETIPHDVPDLDTLVPTMDRLAVLLPNHHETQILIQYVCTLLQKGET